MLNNRQSNRRRGRGRGPQGNGQREGQSRIDNRARGNAPQLLEKYKNLAREAQLQGDRVMTEYYLQFADHYFRIVAESRARFEEQRREREGWQGEDGADSDGVNEDSLADGENSSGQEGEQRDYRPRQETRQDNRRDFNRDRNRNRNFQNGNGGFHDEVAQPSDQDEPSGSISVDILPPALGVTADPIPDIDEAPAPRRRARPRRAAADEAGEEAA